MDRDDLTVPSQLQQDGKPAQVAHQAGVSTEEYVAMLVRCATAVLTEEEKA